MEALDPFFEYYQRELRYLRNSGARFAREFPKIAKRLDLGTTESSDPHVERLLESFAFLTARLQRTIDDDFPQITNALLGALYPQFTEPMPSLTIAKFDTAAEVGKLTAPYIVPEGTGLYTFSSNDEICNFKTCYETQLVPINVVAVDVVSTRAVDLSHVIKSNRALKITLQSFAGSFKKVGVDSLRFYISGNLVLQNQIFAALFAQDPMVVAQSTQGIRVLPMGSIEQVGFKDNEKLVPTSHKHHAGHRLLFEYFHFPEKFLFFDILNLNQDFEEDTLDIYISLATTVPIKQGDVGINNFLLGCTPIINLFPKISEPIKLDHRIAEYRLVGDQRLENSTEIHSILKVNAALEEVDSTKEFLPYFGFNHQYPDREDRSFWHARRIPAINADLEGTDIMLSFVDFDFNPKLPANDVIYAHLMCTNRGLAHQIPSGGILQPEVAVPASSIYCLERPTLQSYPPMEGKTQWQLISNLCLNHLSLSNESESLQALKEIVRLYSNLKNVNDRPEVESLSKLETSLITRRISMDAWRGFVQGTKITLTFDQIGDKETNALLFSSVMNHFFSLFATLNSFTQLEIKSTKLTETWKLWQPLAGNKKLL